MSETQNQPRKQEDEIDLRQLFSAIGDFFSGIGKTVINSVIKVRRRSFEYKWLILVLVIAGISLGLIYNNVRQPVYSSSMLISSDYFNGRIIDNSIEKLNLLSAEEDKVGLAAALGIDQSVALNIVEFEANPFISEDDRVEMEVLKQKLKELDLDEAEINKIISRIEIENKNTFQIIVNVNKSDIISGLEPAIVNYFKNSDYIKNRVVSREQKLKGRLTKLERENLKLDSLKNAMIQVYESMAKKSPQGSDNLYIGDQYSSNPMQVFSEDLRINNELLGIKEELFLKRDFEIVDGLTVFRKPVSAGLLKTIVYSTLISLGIAYILIILISINKYLSKIESERFS
jgi:hypothetical protein